MDAPLDNIVRAVMPGVEIRADDDHTDGRIGTLTGHFAVFDQWTAIRSWHEGEFMERIAPGAAAKTIREHFAAKEARIKVLYDHGQDPQIGNKILGPVEVLEEDDYGVRYEVPLLDSSYARDLLPGLKAGLYGASFRFRVIQDGWDDKPQRSAGNPEGLPERTVQEMQVYEFGPVTFPAYEGATAGVRSVTDQWLVRSGHPLANSLGTPPGAAAVTPPGADDPAEEPPAGHSERTTYTHAELLQRLATAL